MNYTIIHQGEITCALLNFKSLELFLYPVLRIQPKWLHNLQTRKMQEILE